MHVWLLSMNMSSSNHQHSCPACAVHSTTSSGHGARSLSGVLRAMSSAPSSSGQACRLTSALSHPHCCAGSTVKALLMKAPYVAAPATRQPTQRQARHAGAPSAIVPPKDGLEEAPQVGDVARAELHVLMVAPLCPVGLRGPLRQLVQVLAGRDVHHIILRPLQTPVACQLARTSAPDPPVWLQGCQRSCAGTS